MKHGEERGEEAHGEAGAAGRTGSQTAKRKLERCKAGYENGAGQTENDPFQE